MPRRTETKQTPPAEQSEAAPVDVVQQAKDLAATIAATRTKAADQKKAIDFQLYGAILARHVAGQATPQDAEDLAAILDQHGLTPAQLEADLEALRRKQNIERKLVELKAKAANLPQAQEDLHALKRRHKDELASANRRWTQAHHAIGTVRDFDAELSRMSQSRPWLFPTKA